MGNASDILTPNNPANKDVEPKRNRKNRIPMSVPMRKLEVPEISGYHLHWIKESNIPRALQAFYEFVDFNEVPVNQRGVGTDTEMTGNTDLGSRVSIAAGVGADNRPERLVLMKLAEEYWLEDRLAIDTRHAQMLEGIFRGEKILDKDEGVSADVMETRYVDPERTRVQRALFSRRRKKA
jgi:hypothetical protein